MNKWIEISLELGAELIWSKSQSPNRLHTYIDKIKSMGPKTKNRNEMKPHEIQHNAKCEQTQRAHWHIEIKSELREEKNLLF